MSAQRVGFEVSEKKLVTGQLSFPLLCRVLTNMELRIRKEVIELNSHEMPTYNKVEFIAGGNGHSLVKVDQMFLSGYENYKITHLLQHGPYVYDWRPFELVSLLSQATEIFEGESTILILRAPIVIIGDIRGQYQDLHRWLCIVDFPPRSKILFLGGVIDPEEPGSLDCLAFIAAMKVRFPHDVFLIRGMGETLPIVFHARFRGLNNSAVQSLVLSPKKKAATRLCNSLPIAARISNRILAVHSGLSHEGKGTYNLLSLDRFFPTGDSTSKFFVHTIVVYNSLP
ncbi:phosphoprotein phosphatase 1 domain protein [Dictyocaulus viviparus]|uniref:Phosphoprotein phosphatase 1 domain protein n=1 Tax=Dictyocaulus viviparus TaxID=29172 RepID=A0A0D8XGV4_DICVI|nr:phosphoprotein phosphatase 1 domain protein [Dictyocaulus viviparus]